MSEFFDCTKMKNGDTKTHALLFNSKNIRPFI